MSLIADGITVKDLIQINPTGGGRHALSDRISHLTIPPGFSYIPEPRITNIVYKHTTPAYEYTTIPDSEFDRLICLVSVNSKKSPKSHKNRGVNTKNTRRKET
jgi:hypothetical protein